MPSEPATTPLGLASPVASPTGLRGWAHRPQVTLLRPSTGSQHPVSGLFPVKLSQLPYDLELPNLLQRQNGCPSCPPVPLQQWGVPEGPTRVSNGFRRKLFPTLPHVHPALNVIVSLTAGLSLPLLWLPLHPPRPSCAVTPGAASAPVRWAGGGGHQRAYGRVSPICLKRGNKKMKN